MCGIIGYIGHQNAGPLLISGLRRLEYRGYDSAGIAIINDKKKFVRFRSVGNIDQLEKKIKKKILQGHVGIAHTRWATHGKVTAKNAHPHLGEQKKIALVHNGIIENFRELKANYLKNHHFSSQTDSEVLAHLIEEFYLKLPLKKAVEKALENVCGTYGIAVIAKEDPQTIIVARSGSPLAIGIGKDEYFIASDATPILPYTRKILYLDDGEIASISPQNLEVYKMGQGLIVKKPHTIRWNLKEAQRGGFSHFMLKEIFDQPLVFMDAIRGRIREKEGSAHLGGFNLTDYEARKIKKIILLGCGTAYHAGLVGKYLLENLAQIPTETEIGSEFRYRNSIIGKNTLVISLSQSGETLDTLASQREAKRKGAKVKGIINVVGSTIARESEGGTYIHAGPELAVASTKAFTNMLAVLILFSLYLGRLNNLSFEAGLTIIKELKDIPNKINQILATKNKIKKIAERYSLYENMLFLGRGFNYPVALEGSLKMKEISYIHSEACPAGEMKHGTNALLGKDFPVVGIATRGNLYEKMISNLYEIKARRSPLLVITSPNNKEILALTKDVIYVPRTIEPLEPILNTIPLQLLAYYVALKLGHNVDRPKNLAKSVTVE